MKGKKIIAIAAAAAVTVGAVFGGVAFARSRGGEVNVYSASDFITGADWATSAQTDGIVSTDRIQSVYLSNTQVITDIFVEEGQTVKAGDILLAFDTTLSEVNLQRQAIKVEQLELDIRNTKDELRKIGTYRVGVGSSGGNSFTPAESELPAADLLPAPGMPFDRAEDALGTQSDPLIFLWNDECVFSAGFIGEAVGQALANRDALLNGTDPAPAAPVEVDPAAPAETKAPAETQKPAEPETPAQTDEPAETETPVETEPPAETEEPVETESPVETEPPIETEAPLETQTPSETEPAVPAEETGEDGDAVELSAGRVHRDSAKLRAALRRRLAPAGAETDPEVPPVESPLPDIDPAVLAELMDPRVFVVFEVREGDALNGGLQRVWEMVILVDEATGAWSLQMVTPSYDPGDAGDLVEDDMGFDDFYFDDTVYYTAAEIAKMKTEANQKLTDLELQLRQAKLEYDRLEYELSNGEVAAKIDGVVKTLRDPDEARAENKPLLLVSGGGGYYVTAVLGEFDRDTMRVGDTVTVQSWESGEVAEGEITEISEYPDESNRYWYYSEGNQNVSKYPFKVFITEDASLRENENVTLSYSSAASAGGSGVFLELPFVRQENGKSYIFVQGADGLLEKRFVKTGQNLWGSYLEILDGLTEEDLIAFPYGREVKDGAKTRAAETDELYSSMYY